MCDTSVPTTWFIVPKANQGTLVKHFSNTEDVYVDRSNFYLHNKSDIIYTDSALLTPSDKLDLESFLDITMEDLFDTNNSEVVSAINSIGIAYPLDDIKLDNDDATASIKINTMSSNPKFNPARDQYEIIPTRVQLDSGAQVALVHTPNLCCNLRPMSGNIAGIGKGSLFSYSYAGSIHFRVKSIEGQYLNFTHKDFRICPGANEFLFNPTYLTRHAQFESHERTHTDGVWRHIYRHLPTGLSFQTQCSKANDEYIECEVLVPTTPQDVIRQTTRIPVHEPGISTPIQKDKMEQLIQLFGELVTDQSSKTELPVSYNNEKISVQDLLTKATSQETLLKQITTAYKLHCIAGHRHPKDLALLCESLGIKAGRIWEIFCAACLKGHARRTSATDMAKLPTLLPPIRPLGRTWSMDAAGPFEPSLHGNRYFFVLVSDDTKTAFIYFTKSLKTYSEIAALVVEDIKNTLMLMGETEIQVQVSLRFTRIKSDQASYFTAEKNVSSYTNNGIKTTFSGVYNGFQNCYAERIIGTICSMAYTMRHHANAPKNVWDFAILLAWEIYDNSPHSNLPENMSPRQFRTGKLQSIFDYLHIFWALTAIWIPPSQRNKSESKAKFGRYAGYDRQSRSHWVLVPTDNARYRIHRSQHIRVDPRPFPPKADGCILPPLTDGPISELNHSTKLDSNKFKKKQANQLVQLKQHLYSQMVDGDLVYVTPCTKGWYHVSSETQEEYYLDPKYKKHYECPPEVESYPREQEFVFSKGIPRKPTTTDQTLDPQSENQVAVTPASQIPH